MIVDPFDPPPAAPQPGVAKPGIVDPFDPAEAPPAPQRSALAEIAAGAKRFFPAMEQATAATSAGAQEAAGQPVDSLTQRALDQAKANLEANKAEPGHGWLTRAIAAAPEAIGSFVPMAAAQFGGELAGPVGGAAAAGAQQYAQAYHEGAEEARAAGNKTPEEVAAYAGKQATMSGALGAGFGAIPLLGPLARAAGKAAGLGAKTATEVGTKLTTQEMLPALAKRAAVGQAGLTAYSTAAAVGGNVNREEAGLPGVTSNLEAAKQGALGSLEGGLAFAPFWALHARGDVKTSAKIANDLKDPTAAPGDRLKAVITVSREMKRVDEPGATAFFENAMGALQRGEAIPIEPPRPRDYTEQRESELQGPPRPPLTQQGTMFPEPFDLEAQEGAPPPPPGPPPPEPSQAQLDLGEPFGLAHPEGEVPGRPVAPPTPEPTQAPLDLGEPFGLRAPAGEVPPRPVTPEPTQTDLGLGEPFDLKPPPGEPPGAPPGAGGTGTGAAGAATPGAPILPSDGALTKTAKLGPGPSGADTPEAQKARADGAKAAADELKQRQKDAQDAAKKQQKATEDAAKQQQQAADDAKQAAQDKLDEAHAAADAAHATHLKEADAAVSAAETPPAEGEKVEKTENAQQHHDVLGEEIARLQDQAKALRAAGNEKGAAVLDREVERRLGHQKTVRDNAAKEVTDASEKPSAAPVGGEPSGQEGTGGRGAAGVAPREQGAGPTAEAAPAAGVPGGEGKAPEARLKSLSDEQVADAMRAYGNEPTSRAANEKFLHEQPDLEDKLDAIEGRDPITKRAAGMTDEQLNAAVETLGDDPKDTREENIQHLQQSGPESAHDAIDEVTKQGRWATPAPEELRTRYAASVTKWNQLANEYRGATPQRQAELRPQMDALHTEQEAIKAQAQGSNEPAPFGKGRVEDIVAQKTAELGHAPPIEVLSHVSELKDEHGKPLTDSSDALKSAIAAGANVRGMYWRGKVYLFAKELHDRADVEFALDHELGHNGFDRVLGDRREKTFQRIYDSNADVRAAAQTYIDKEGYAPARAAEEVMADRSGRGDWKGVKGWQLLWAEIRSGLRRMGIDLKFSDEDVAHLLAKSRRSVAGGPGGGGPVLSTRSRGELVDVNKQIPPGERESPMSGTVPIKGRESAQGRLSRALAREPGVGGPDNPRRVLHLMDGTKFVVGDLTAKDWADRVSLTLSPPDIQRAREWYGKLHDLMSRIFGEKNAERMSLTWLMSQQNTSPSGGMLNVLRAADVVSGLPVIKQAGLGHDRLIALLRGEIPKEGYGAKLLDFVDSELHKSTRTVMGDDPRGKAPAVIDLWANRDVGKIDTQVMKWLKENVSPDQLKGLKVDGERIAETDYEHGVNFYHDLVNALNASGFDGGKWKSYEAQAVGWVAMQERMGIKAEHPEDLFDKNTRRVSLGLASGHGAPMGSGVPIDPASAHDAILRAAKATGVIIRRMPIKQSAYRGEGEPAFQIDVLGSPEAFQDFAAVLGHSLQQTEVIISRPKKSGDTQGVSIMQEGGAELGDPAKAEAFMAAVRARLRTLVPAKGGKSSPNYTPIPEIGDGYQGITEDGRHGLRIFKGTWNPNTERVQWTGKWDKGELDAFHQAVNEVAHEQGYGVHFEQAQFDVGSEYNDWHANPNGEAYRSSLQNRSRGLLEGRLRNGEFRLLSDAERQAAGSEVTPPGPRGQEPMLSTRSRDEAAPPADRWYSALSRAIPKAPWSKAGELQAPALRAWLDARIKDGTFKRDEVEWTGLNDYLKLQDGKVSRDELQQFLKNNGVKVSEQLLGKSDPPPGYIMSQSAPNSRFKMEWSGTIAHGDTPQDAALELQGKLQRVAQQWQRNGDNARAERMFKASENLNDYIENIGDHVGGATQYGVNPNLQLPGGKNYRELLLTLPPKENTEQRFKVTKQGPYVPLVDTVTGKEVAHGTYGQMREEASKRNAEASGKQAMYVGGHFGETAPNVLAHVRFNDRVDADGKKVLFLEELQSDWAQKGRKEGFAGADAARIKELEHKVATHVATEVDFMELKNLQRYEKTQAVPSAPFVGKTEAWTALAMKRMIRYAAENGYDKIAWTKGEQQADRYSLASHADTVKLSPRDDGKYRLMVDKGGRSLVDEENVSMARVQEVVGKEMASKLAATEPRHNGVVVLEGQDLKVGGEGMKGYYDKIVPGVANDTLRKLGGEKVGEVKIPGARDMSPVSGEQVMDHLGIPEAEQDRYWRKLTESEQDKLFEKYRNRDTSMTQQGFDITPAMRDKVMSEGAPLFSTRGRDDAMASTVGGNPLYSGLAPQERARPSVFDAFRKIFVPASRGALAVQQAGNMRHHLAQMAQESERANVTMANYSKVFSRLSQQQAIDFVNAYERGGVGAVPPELRAIAVQMKAFNEDLTRRVQALGLGKLDDAMDNYLGRIWMDAPGKVRSVMARRPLAGGQNFLKQRFYQYYSDGLAAGLKPLTYNPIEMMLLKGVETRRYIYAQQIFQEMQNTHMTAKWEPGKQPDGWTQIDDRIAQAGKERYYAPDEAATLLNNHVSAGLQGNGVYDMIRNSGSFLNSTQLGLSAFHLGFTTLDAMVSKAALGFGQISRGNFLKGVGNLVQAVNPATPVFNYLRGDRLLKAYLGQLQDPGLAPIVDAMLSGGGRAQLDAFYRNGAVNAFKNALSRQDKLGAAKAFLPMVMDKVNAPIFEHLVPRQKMGVFFDLAKDWLDRNPAPANAAHSQAYLEKKREAMGKLWDSVDNRMGQLAYDNVFWNRTLKDALMVSVRSVGWNLGTFREIGGGVLDLKNIAKNKELSTRTAYLMGLPFTVAIMGSVIGYLYGQPPEDIKDMFFPRTGKTRPDGSPDRVSLPSYIKDIFEYGHDISGFVKYGADPTQTLKNKMHPLLGLVSEMVNNKDFFGGAIRSPGDPLMQQLQDEVSFVATQMAPFGVRNFGQQQQLKGEKGFDPAGYVASPSFVGVTPAPGYITKTDAQTEAAALGAQKDALVTKFTEEMQSGTPPGEIIKRALAVGLRPQEITMIIHRGMAALQNMKYPSKAPPRALRPDVLGS